MTTIKASAKKVWDVLWNDASYRAWTKPFNESSYAVSDWKEGSKILFLSGDGSGMHSIIDKKVPGQYMAFKHMGIVKDGIEQPADEESKSWAGAMETYTLNEKNGMTELKVELDVTEEYEQYFIEPFPKALEKVKELAEESS